MDDAAQPDPDSPREASAQPPGGAERRLRRSRTDRVLTGVSGGLGAYLNVDAVVIRIGWVLLGIVTGGAAILGYVITWLVMPEESADEAAGRPSPARSGSSQTSIVLGAVLVVVGGAWLLATLTPDIFRFRGFFALALVGVGAILVIQGMRR